MSVTYLRVKPTYSLKCLLCDKDISETEVCQVIKTEGLETIRSKAELWSKIDVCANEDPYFQFTQSHARVTETLLEELKCHNSCRILFLTRLERFQNKYG